LYSRLAEVHGATFCPTGHDEVPTATSDTGELTPLRQGTLGLALQILHRLSQRPQDTLRGNLEELVVALLSGQVPGPQRRNADDVSPAHGITIQAWLGTLHHCPPHSHPHAMQAEIRCRPRTTQRTRAPRTPWRAPSAWKR
jgi:hypothetical protein